MNLAPFMASLLLARGTGHGSEKLMVYPLALPAAESATSAVDKILAWYVTIFGLSSETNLVFFCVTMLDICFKAQEWWDMSANGEARSSLFNDNLPSPFKAGEPSPLRSIPGGSDASAIKPDLLHNFNLGMGGDMWVSTLWGLCRMKVFESRSIQARLDSAFDRFETWCSWNKNTPHIKCFDAIKFKMTSILFCVLLFFSGGLECSFGPSTQFTTQPCKVLNGIGSKDKELSSEGRASS